MANQKNQQGRPAMDEEKRNSGSKDHRDQYRPEKQQPEIDPGKKQNPDQKSGRNS